MKYLSFLVLVVFPAFCYGQTQRFEKWTSNEQAQYENLLHLAQYVSGKEKDDISNGYLFENYIYFDNVLTDTLATRKS